MELLDERQAILMESPVDMVKLNNLDLKLHDLGVDFHDQDEVAEIFPDAASAINELTNNTSAESDSSASTFAFELPENSPNNSWASYTTSDFFYLKDGKYYNIQRVIVQPIGDNPNSVLWDEDWELVYYQQNWTAGITSFFTAMFELGISENNILNGIYTVYDVLSSVWSALQPVTSIAPANAMYDWKNSTTALFTYVRLESDPDELARLVYVATRCITDIDYKVRIEEWSIDGSTNSTVREVKYIEGSERIRTTPDNFYSLTHACWSKNNWQGGPINDQIYSIVISGPESKVSVRIYPACPGFPAGLEL